MQYIVRSLTKTVSKSRLLQGIAYILMILDHIAIVYAPGQIIYRLPGRVVFPIFAGLVCYGMTKTSDRLGYIQRIIMLGMASQIPYTLALKSPMPNDVLYLGIIAIVFGIFDKKEEVVMKTAKKLYWHYAIYPGHLVVLYALKNLL